MKQIFDDAGLTYLQVEFLADFFVDARRAGAGGSPTERRKLLFDDGRERSARTTSKSATSPAPPASSRG